MIGAWSVAGRSTIGTLRLIFNRREFRFFGKGATRHDAITALIRSIDPSSWRIEIRVCFVRLIAIIFYKTYENKAQKLETRTEVIISRITFDHDCETLNVKQLTISAEYIVDFLWMRARDRAEEITARLTLTGFSPRKNHPA